MNEAEPVRKLPNNAVWKHFGGKGETAHFYHATGFPAGVYTPLLSQVSQQLEINALNSRAMWPDIGLPPKRRDWLVYADDLITFIEQECKAPIIGIGHSMGATCTILAADKRPDLFKALVLIEPAMLTRTLARLARMMPKAIMDMIEPAKSTLRKTDIWPSREAFVAYCKERRVFRRFEEESFQSMAQHAVVEAPQSQFQLTFPKIWEAHSYTQPPNVMANIERLKMPCIAIRGKPSAFFTQALWQEWQDCSPDTVFKEDLTYGHLLPLENPSSCYKLIKAGLSEIL